MATATISVKVPFEDKPLQVIWKDRKVKVKGNRFALLYWNSLLSEGMFGMFGHGVNFKDTEVSDLVSALYNRVGSDGFTLDEAAKSIVKKEAEERKPLPKGAVS